MGTVLILLWDGSAYDSLRALLMLVADELRDEGFAVETLTLFQAGWGEVLQTRLNRGGIAFALGMSGVGCDLRAGDGRLLWEAAGVLFFDWCCDHPCYFPSRHKLQSPFLRHGYVFPDHAAYAARHLGPGAETFAVHIGLPRPALFPGAPLPLRERNGRLLFVKSGADPAATLARWRSLPPPLRDLLPEAADALVRQGATSDALPALRRLGEARGIYLGGASPLALALVREIDAHVRSVRANLVLDALKPYPVDVYGSGWDHVDWTGARAVHCGTLGFGDMNARLPAYLGSVSLNLFVDGSVHDRVTFALAAGVAPLSDANAFWRSRLPALAPFGFAFKPDEVRGAAEALLADPAGALARAETARAGLEADMTLRHSVRAIAAIARFRLS